MLLKAALSHFVALRDRSAANLNVYLASSAGIGEHSDIIEAMDKEIGEIGKYDDRLSMIIKYLERRQANEIEEKKESKSK